MRRVTANLQPSLAGLKAMFFLVLIGIVVASVLFLWRGRRFIGFDRFNLVVQAKPVTLVSLDSKQKTVTVVSFPDDLFISPVVPNYGGYKISSVYQVGQLDKRGGKVLSWTVADFLGIPVDGYLVTNRNVDPDIKRSFLSPAIFKGESDMNFLDLAQFAFNLVQVRFDRVRYVDLGKLASPLILADGTKAMGVDREQLDDLLSGYFAEASIGEEASRVEVVNTSPVVGLGARVARCLGNIGATVVNVSSTEGLVKQCEVRAEKKNLKTVAARRIAQIYGCSLVEKPQEGRADMVMVLGSDLAERFKQ